MALTELVHPEKYNITTVLSEALRLLSFSVHSSKRISESDTGNQVLWLETFCLPQPMDKLLSVRSLRSDWSGCTSGALLGEGTRI